jgi:uncharacterized protein YggE
MNNFSKEIMNDTVKNRNIFYISLSFLALAIALGVLIAAKSYNTIASNMYPVSTYSVTASAKQKFTPDMAEISFYIKGESATSSVAAQAYALEKLSKIQSGIATTSGVSLATTSIEITLPGEGYYPISSYDDEQYYSSDFYDFGYNAMTTFPADSDTNKNYGYGIGGKITITPISAEKVLAVKTALHAVIDTKSKTGDYADMYPVYTLKDKQAAYSRLIKAASANARKQAESVADSAEMHLGRALSLTVGNTSGSYDEYGYSSYQETAETFFGYMNLGENEYSQTVTVTYEVQ